MAGETRFSIGEFSKISGLTVKTLRFYHEKGILIPTLVEAASGYRYYDSSCVDRSRVIRQLRDLEISLTDIRELLEGHEEDDSDILEFLERHLEEIRGKERQYRTIAGTLKSIISIEREAQKMAENSSDQIEEKSLESTLIAGVRMRGLYSEIGKGFSQIGRKLGRHIAGKPFCLHYDEEFKERDADFEACMPVKHGIGGRGKEVDGISVRELPATRCVSLIHRGPYDQLGRSYARVFEYIKQKGLEVVMPTREIYVKGPGMLFRGNPKKYVTEIQIPVSQRESRML